jgi:NMD protein affecting ribosome stability and mRNA decay
MTRYCDECGRELEEWEDDICEDCMNNFAAGIIHTDGIWPNEDDL